MTAVGSSPRVVISGLGFVTSIGNDRAAVTRSLRELRSGIELIDLLPGGNLPVTVAGTIKGFDTPGVAWPVWRWPDGYEISRDLLRGLPPHGLYAIVAFEQALADACLPAAEVANAETGLFCASAGSPRLMRHFLNQAFESRGERVAPMGIVSAIAGTLNFNLAAHYRIQGAVGGFSSACASTTQAIGYATDEIRLGRQKRMFVVGGEDVTFESIFPFHGMRALSLNADPARASRPFDCDRDGFVGTGGAVALLLENADTALARGAKIEAEILGWGQAADGYNVAGSDPEGRGLALAMRRALRDAKATPGEIDYVNAHATSTPAGDRSEALALHAVFTPANAHPAVSSTKALTGHGLSLAGAMETAFCALSIAEGFIPGAANLEKPDPVCDGLNLPRATLSEAPRRVLKNSSAFGGSNVCVVLGRWEG
ncbi:MAG: beta-ketoacyl-[acyl-carrier-protein] synthase family protein [Opitutaceae bacterium]